MVITSFILDLQGLKKKRFPQDRCGEIAAGWQGMWRGQCLIQSNFSSAAQNPLTSSPWARKLPTTWAMSSLHHTGWSNLRLQNVLVARSPGCGQQTPSLPACPSSPPTAFVLLPFLPIPTWTRWQQEWGQKLAREGLIASSLGLTWPFFFWKGWAQPWLMGGKGARV